MQRNLSDSECCLVALQMFFETKKSCTAHANLKTWQAYAETMQKDCSVPCEQINSLEGTNISAQHDAVLDSYDLCDTCGIDGNELPMARCGCCLEKQQETVACLTCIPKDHVAWIQADEDRHHWRCRRCRCYLCSYHVHQSLISMIIP